jgi:hypothetical protein
MWGEDMLSPDAIILIKAFTIITVLMLIVVSVLLLNNRRRDSIEDYLNNRDKKEIRPMRERRFDIKWQRSNAEEIFECTGLTAVELIARIINVIKNCGCIIIHEIKIKHVYNPLSESASRQIQDMFKRIVEGNTRELS